MPAARLLLVAAVAAVAGTSLGACTRARRGEVVAALAAARAAEAAASAPGAAPGAGSVGRPLEDEPFFRGLAPLVARLSALPFAARAPDGALVVDPARLEDAEAELRAAMAPEARRRVPTFFAFGQAARLPTTPGRVAEAVLDAATEKAALDADELVEVGRAREGAREERVLRIALLRKGEGPFRYDFRWSLRFARLDRADGAVLLRYDLVADAARERVTWFSGAALLVPDGGGTVVREVVALGSDTAPPFFLKAKVRGAVRDILAKRWVVVWGRAVAAPR